MTDAAQRDTLHRLFLAVSSLSQQFSRENAEPDQDKVLQLGIVCTQLSATVASMAAQKIIEKMAKQTVLLTAVGG